MTRKGVGFPRNITQASHRSIIIPAITGLVGTALGLVAALVVTPAVLTAYVGLISLFLAFCFFSMILFVMYQIYVETKEEKQVNEGIIQGIINKERLPLSVSTLVVFLERKDSITVYGNGDALFDCEYDIRLDPGNNFGSSNDFVEYLHFPVIIDLPDEGDFDSNVAVQLIEVDDKPVPIQGHYVARELRKRKAENGEYAAQEYGLVAVPVRMSATQARRRVRIVTKYRELFMNRFSSDYIVVDIPYLTNALDVIIRAEDENHEIFEPTKRSMIDAIGEMMDLHDDAESRAQAKDIRQNNGQITWTTAQAKIGYRYKIYFRLVDRSGKEPGQEQQKLPAPEPEPEE